MKYSDISKPSKDLLNDDYTSSIVLKCKSAAGPVGVTIETERSSAGTLSSKVGGKFSYAGLNFDKLQAKADGSNVLETSLTPCTGCKITFKANEKEAGFIVDFITKCEQDVYDKLAKAFAETPDTFFKAMRRKAPGYFFPHLT